MLLTCSEMRHVEESAFAEGATAEALMEEAGAGIARVVRQYFPTPGRCLAVFGKGHNGGDALVAARYLREAGWQVELRPAFAQQEWTDLTRRQHERLAQIAEAVNPGGSARVVLDGLLGIGAGGPLRAPIREACREINQLRRAENAHVFALDLPTGLDGDTGSADPEAVVADTTITIGFAKAGLVADGAANHVGRLVLVPLDELTSRAPGNRTATIATARTLRELLPPRSFDTHKGDYGRIGIVAGSRGLVGAAVLCAEGAVRAGGGLVMLYVPRDIYEVAAAKAPPEVMVHPIDSPVEVLRERLDAIAIGPGLGRENPADVLELIERSELPAVLDADALNILATRIGTLDRCAGPRILTPHPGEMARLDAESGQRTRQETVAAFTARYPHALLLKGSRTIVGWRERQPSFNTSGHPGMATGGMGDVTTGVIAALAGAGSSLYDAGRVAAWVVGRAAEQAIFGGAESPETLRPTSVLDALGRAFSDLRAGLL